MLAHVTHALSQAERKKYTLLQAGQVHKMTTISLKIVKVANGSLTAEHKATYSLVFRDIKQW